MEFKDTNINILTQSEPKPNIIRRKSEFYPKSPFGYVAYWYLPGVFSHFGWSAANQERSRKRLRIDKSGTYPKGDFGYPLLKLVYTF